MTHLTETATQPTSITSTKSSTVPEYNRAKSLSISHINTNYQPTPPRLRRSTQPISHNLALPQLKEAVNFTDLHLDVKPNKHNR
jgi:hypothetical protein